MIDLTVQVKCATEVQKKAFQEFIAAKAAELNITITSTHSYSDEQRVAERKAFEDDWKRVMDSYGKVPSQVQNAFRSMLCDNNGTAGHGISSSDVNHWIYGELKDVISDYTHYIIKRVNNGY